MFVCILMLIIIREIWWNGYTFAMVRMFFLKRDYFIYNYILCRIACLYNTVFFLFLSILNPVNSYVSDHSLDTSNINQPSAKSVVAPVDAEAAACLSFDLEECIAAALDRNQQRTVSLYSVQLAETQHRMALSAYWPTLMLNSTYTRLDERPTFVFPQETSRYKIEGLSPIPIDAQVTVPEKKVLLMDRDNVAASLDLVVPLYTGGVRSSVAKQARSGVDAAKQEMRRTDLKIVYDVKRMYYGVVLAEVLHRLGEEALARMEATLALTDRLYREGSGRGHQGRLPAEPSHRRWVSFGARSIRKQSRDRQSGVNQLYGIRLEDESQRTG